LLVLLVLVAWLNWEEDSGQEEDGGLLEEDDWREE
jgi:hypothetical protein